MICSSPVAENLKISGYGKMRKRKWDDSENTSVPLFEKKFLSIHS